MSFYCYVTSKTQSLSIKGVKDTRDSEMVEECLGEHTGESR